MKIAICAIAKAENNYVEEWINHYIDVVGAEHVYLYDNNDRDYEDVATRIHKHKDKVDIIKWASGQWEAYNDCWKLQHDNYDWIGFFDLDEFLVLHDEVKLQNLLEQKPYCESSSVRISWKMFDDNDLIERDISIPLMQSFTRFNTQWVLSKSLYNCNVREKNIPLNEHGDKGEDGKMLDICGEPCYSGIPETNNATTYHVVPGKKRPYFDVGVLNHYRSKSLMEYINKVKVHSKGIFSIVFNNSDKVIQYYFDSPNKVTQKKLDVFAKHGFIPSEELMKKLKSRIKDESKHEDKKDFNVAIVAIARCENKYINNWISYHRNLGVQHFYIYDNAYDDEQHIDESIDDDNRGYTTIIPAYDNHELQIKAYENAYKDYGNEHDFMLFIDVDEFLTLMRHPNIMEYINFLSNKHPNFHAAKIHWQIYDDNDAIERDTSIPVQEFFTHKSTTVVANDHNNLVKTLLRTKIPGIKFGNPHWVYSTEWHLMQVDGSGNNINFENQTNLKYPFYCVPCDHSVAKIRHYTTKTISEYLEQQYNRGGGFTRPHHSLNKFQWYCQWNYDKMRYFYEWKMKHFIRPKSALVCVTNNEEFWRKRMINAINSVFFHCSDLIDTVHVYVIGKTTDISMNGINPHIKYTKIISSQDCASLWNNYYNRSTLYKLEMFKNKVFRQYDNIIYIDSDTECQSYIGELFNRYNFPGIHGVRENQELKDEDIVKKEFGMTHQYNTGVLLITPSTISPMMDEMFQYMVMLCKDHPKFRRSDQDAINLMIQKYPDLIHPLDCKYNWFSCTRNDSCTRENAKIVHHTGGESKNYDLKYLL